MIEIFSGVLGASKTCHAVVRIMEAFAEGKVVSTNIVLNWDEVVSYCRDELEYEVDRAQYVTLVDQQILEFYKYAPRGQKGLHNLVVLDEFPMWFPSSASSSKVQKEAFNWARQSRKDWTDMILIAQRIERISLEFRELTQYYWKFKDMKRTRIFGGVRLPMFLELCYDEDRKIVQHRAVKPKNPRWFKLYDTDQMLKPFERPEAVKHKGQKVKRKKNMGKLALVLGVFLIAALGALLTRPARAAAPVAAKCAPVTVHGSPVPAASAAPMGPGCLATAVSSPAAKAAIPRLTYRGCMIDGKSVILRTNEGTFERGDVTPWGKVVDLSERHVTFQGDAGKVIVRVYDPVVTPASAAPTVSASPGALPSVASSCTK